MAGSISSDGVRSEIAENALVAGNPVKNASKVPVSAVTQLTASALGVLQQTASLPVVQPTLTEPIFDLTGIANGNILTQTLVPTASVTTFTVAGYARINITAANDALLSTSSYYVAFGTIV